MNDSCEYIGTCPIPKGEGMCAIDPLDCNQYWILVIAQSRRTEAYSRALLERDPNLIGTSEAPTRDNQPRDLLERLAEVDRFTRTEH
jgi:hypothetical protein